MEENIENSSEMQIKNESTFQNSNAKKGFLEKHYQELKWSISVYHLFFALWASYIFLKGVIPAINNLIFTIPLLFFIITSVVGSYRLLKDKSNPYNYLIAAQIPQVIILELNGFLYLLLIGQWIILRIGGGQLWGINFGIFDAKYYFLFSNPNQSGFMFGINILPIVIIFILLKMEETEEKIDSNKTHNTKLV